MLFIFLFDSDVEPMAIFIEIISRYYPLNNDQIERYKDLLEFVELSSNKNLKWENGLNK